MSSVTEGDYNTPLQFNSTRLETARLRLEREEEGEMMMSDALHTSTDVVDGGRQDIEMWSMLLKKANDDNVDSSRTEKEKLAEKDLHEVLAQEELNKLRALLVEIANTDWMFTKEKQEKVVLMYSRDIAHGVQAVI